MLALSALLKTIHLNYYYCYYCVDDTIFIMLEVCVCCSDLATDSICFQASIVLIFMLEHLTASFLSNT